MQTRRRAALEATLSAEPTPQRSQAAADDAALAPSKPLAVRLLPLLLLLFTGTVSTIIAQLVIDKDFADKSVQHLALTKYVAILTLAPLGLLLRSLAGLVSVPRSSARSGASSGNDGSKADGHASERSSDGGVCSRGEGGQGIGRSRRATRLMLTLAVLDVASYFMHCLGFALCGSALATVIFAAAGQLLTAAMTRYLLHRRLLRGQKLAVLLVCVGIALRAAAYSNQQTAAGSAGKGAGVSQRCGVAAMLGSAVGYSSLGVLYDLLVRTEQPAPSHSEIMVYTSRLGLVASIAYQLVYTLPRWRQLVSLRLRASGTTPLQAVTWLGLFGAVYDAHSFAQGRVQRTDGALGVGLVTAVRSATVSLASGLLFCSPSSPAQCLTPLTAASAVVVTLGGVAWVLAVAPKPQAGSKTE